MQCHLIPYFRKMPVLYRGARWICRLGLSATHSSSEKMEQDGLEDAFGSKARQVIRGRQPSLAVQVLSVDEVTLPAAANWPRWLGGDDTAAPYRCESSRAGTARAGPVLGFPEPGAGPGARWRGFPVDHRDPAWRAPGPGGGLPVQPSRDLLYRHGRPGRPARRRVPGPPGGASRRRRCTARPAASPPGGAPPHHDQDEHGGPHHAEREQQPRGARPPQIVLGRVSGPPHLRSPRDRTHRTERRG